MVYPTDSDVTLVKKHGLTISLKYDPWLAVVLACFILMACASWGKAEHPILDIGREFEIPARLVAGQLLYRDMATYYGPLAYYANALALLVFGHHLEVFYAIGLTLSLATTLLVYRLAKRLTNAPWAVLCTACIQLYCALGPGLTNFILPYSYGAVYATVLCLLAIAALDCYGCSGKAKWLVVAAIACGLAGLAKQEYGVAALGGVLVGVNFYSPQNLQTRVWRNLLVIAIAAVCVLLPLALLAQQVSWKQLYESLIPVSQVRILNRSSFFQVSPAKTISVWLDTFDVFAATSSVVWGSMGVAYWLSKRKYFSNSQWLRELVWTVTSFTFSLIGLILLRINLPQSFNILVAALLVVWVSVVVFYSRQSKKLIESERSKTIFKIFTGITLIGISLFLLRKLTCCSNNVFYLLNNISWFIPLAVAWFAWSWSKLIRHRNAPLLWTLLIFSLLLNSRWLYYINFYGLYATPVILLFFTLLYYLAQRTGTPVWRFLLICLLIGGSIKLGRLSTYRYAVSSSHGTLYVRDAALACALNQTIDAVNVSKATSVLALPEGSILTFLTATHSPSREITFLPPTLPTSKAEQEFIRRMQSNPPDLIVYIDRSFKEWGYQTYADFNPLVDNWITHQHKLVNVFPNSENAIVRLFSRS